MFFGKHEHELLQDVPPSYLMWAWDNTGLKGMSKNLTEQEANELKKKPWVYRRTLLANYIFNSMDAIKLELKESGRE